MRSALSRSLCHPLRIAATADTPTPACLLCTDSDLPLAEALQSYLWRWGIEVNFREEKTLIGTGDAQVGGEVANEHQPAITVATYSQLWVAALTLQEDGKPITPLRPPKWRARTDQPPAPSTGELLRCRGGGRGNGVIPDLDMRQMAGKACA